MIIPNFRTFLIIDSFCVLFSIQRDSNLTNFLLPQEGHVGPLPFKIAGSAPVIMSCPLHGTTD